MFKLLSSLVSLLSGLWSFFHTRQLRAEGRQQAIKEAEDEVQRQVDLAEHVSIASDPDYDQRLRSRFDAAAADPGSR